MSFVSTASTLNIGDASSNTVNITAATNLNLGKTGGTIISNADQPASTDSSTKIPTTAWVQGAITYNINTYTVKYTTNQTITTPANCRAIDILLIGAGGAAGTTIPGTPTYYGGSGSGGNTISCSNIPMGPNEQLDLTFSLDSTTGATELKRGGVTLAKSFNGSAGVNAIAGTNAGGATVNNTVGIGDTSFGSFYTSFGSAGAGSTSNGTVEPSMTGGVGCPKGYGTWFDNDYGMAQKSQSGSQGPGLCVITYHIG